MTEPYRPSECPGCSRQTGGERCERCAALDAHQLAGSPGVPVVALLREELLELYPPEGSHQPEQFRPADGHEGQHEQPEDERGRDPMPLGKRG